MLPQTEEIRTEDTIGGQTVPLNNVAVGNSPRRRWLALAIALIAVAALLVSGIWSRVRARTTLNTETTQTALPAVSVVSPKQTTPAEEIILSGNVQPFISSPIYARTNGYLMKSGSSGTPETDLFHIAQPGKLRVYVNVPEEYSRGVKVGMTADLSLAEFPGRKFQGTLVRTAEAINMTTRTLLIEIEVDNPKSTLLTGSYAEVHLKVPTQKSTFLLPVNTLLFRSERLRVGVVQDGKVVLAAVTPGHDFGNQIEIVAGLKTGDQVIVNPPDSLVSGQQVQIVQATLPGDSK